MENRNTQEARSISAVLTDVSWDGLMSQINSKTAVLKKAAG